MTNDVRRPLGSGSYLAVPDQDVRAAVLVLTGSSGRLDEQRTELLARCGVVALAFQWFGGDGQQPGICDVPLEVFTPALDLLIAHHERLAVLGVSKGAEAALLLGAHDPRIALVAALSPTSVVWAGIGCDQPGRSSFSVDGVGLPFVPYDDSWRQPTGVPAYRGMYEQSLTTHADLVPAASIPVERIAGDVLVAAGGDDQVWPSVRFAEQIGRRRADAGLTTTALTDGSAGHRLLLPGEELMPPMGDMQRGGTETADRALGAVVWRAFANWCR